MANKKYFITGVSDGLGREFCKILLARGDTVYGVSRRQCEMPAAGGRFIWRYCDVSNPADIKEVIAHQNSIGFMPDVVILNAAVYTEESPEFLFEDYRKSFGVNAEGALRWVEAYLPGFRKRGRGHFVYISSISSIFPPPYKPAYSASKSYVSTAFASLRKRYAGSGILFTTIYPGLIGTAMSMHLKAPKFFRCPVEKAASKIIKAVLRGKKSYIFPVRNLLLNILLSLLPDRLFLRLYEKRK